MNSYLDTYVQDGRAIAEQRGVQWDVPLDLEGVAISGRGWNLTEMVGDSPPPITWMNDFGTDRGTVEQLNCAPGFGPVRTYRKVPLSQGWQDFLMACAIDQLFVRRNTCPHVVGNVVRPLRVLATCSPDTEPWQITADHVAFAISTARKIQPSGKLADLIFGVVKNILDLNHLTNAGPLCPSLVRDKKVHKRTSKFTKAQEEIRSDLEERKNAEKLPERRAFWELTRIVFTEEPKSFLDFLRFSLTKVLILTGLRDGECTMLPADWKRYREHFDCKGRPAGQAGGISKSLTLRHFAEKQRTLYEDSIALFETVQFVPLMFEDILTSTLDQVVQATQPLRNTLQRQIETGRVLPQFEPGDLVRAAELYTYLTGNPFVTDLPKEVRQRYVATYRHDYNPKIFEELRSAQLEAIREGQGLSIAAYMYYRRFKGPPLRRLNGSAWEGKKNFAQMYLRIGEVEEFLKSELPTKQSDSTAIRLANGELSASELMFLMPKRALAEGLGAGLCDVTRACAVGRFDRNMISNALSGSSKLTLFEAYGQTDQDRELRLLPHSLRHLQNTELFRLAVADTLITKRFNRKSVAQSYHYDHRSLSEDLEMIDLKPEIEARLGEKSATIARLIKSGLGQGPIVEAFKKIQREQGEEAAIEYLVVEADGFHSTPWGNCINSFTVDPCKQHVECINGCRHLLATGITEHRSALVQLEVKFETAIKAIEIRKQSIAQGSPLNLKSSRKRSKPTDLSVPPKNMKAVPFSGIGMENQLKHAKTRLAGVRKLLATHEGYQVFPDGPDLSRGPRKSVGTVLDDIL